VSGGGFLILAGVAETVNLKIDVLMLTELSGLKSVSIYSVATKFSESSYFFAAAIVTSFFPKIMEAKASNQAVYYKVLEGLARKVLVVCLGVFLLTAIFAYPAIYYLYGVEYMDSYYVLIIHLFASFFVYFRAVVSKWIMAEHLLKYSLITYLFGGVVNVGLNLFLIPHYGYYGAAISTVVSYSFSSYFSLLFFKEPRYFLTNIHFNIIGRFVK
jgi:O-antigen/teichoic acid export membrane protein